MKSVITFFVIVCFSFSGQAQIFDRLVDKATKSAERTIERKVEQKSANETDKAFDSVFESPDKPSESIERKTPESVYEFSHKYVMQIESDKYTTNLTYYLAKNKNFFGSTMEAAASMFTVMDFDKRTMFMFTEAGGKKMLMASKLDLNDIISDDLEENPTAQIEKTGNSKTILGFECSEYLVTSKDMKGSFWITQDANITFPNGFYQVSDKKKKSNQAWMSNMEGIMMEMHIIDTSKRKPQTMIMRCVELEESSFKINTSEYKKFM